jgi:ketol-acid reductoisomerase
MVAPKAQAIPFATSHTQGGGVPHLIALYQDRAARQRTLSYAIANGGIALKIRS